MGQVEFFRSVFPLADGRQIEASCFLAGRVLRLSATLVDADFVIRRSHRGVYLYDPQTWVRDIEAFTTEFEAVAGVDLPWTLLPAP